MPFNHWTGYRSNGKSWNITGAEAMLWLWAVRHPWNVRYPASRNCHKARPVVLVSTRLAVWHGKNRFPSWQIGCSWHRQPMVFLWVFFKHRQTVFGSALSQHWSRSSRWEGHHLQPSSGDLVRIFMLCVYIRFTCDCFPDSYCHGCSRHCKATFPTFSCKFGTGGALFGSSIGSSSASPMAEDRIARRKLEEEKEKEHIAVEEEPGWMLWPWDVQHLVLFLPRENFFFWKLPSGNLTYYITMENHHF